MLRLSEPLSWVSIAQSWVWQAGVKQGGGGGGEEEEVEEGGIHVHIDSAR